MIGREKYIKAAAIVKIALATPIERNRLMFSQNAGQATGACPSPLAPSVRRLLRGASQEYLSFLPWPNPAQLSAAPGLGIRCLGIGRGPGHGIPPPPHLLVQNPILAPGEETDGNRTSQDQSTTKEPGTWIGLHVLTLVRKAVRVLIEKPLSNID
jgi:hypothetical protein